MPQAAREFIRFFQAKKNGTFKCVFCGNEEFVTNVAAPAPIKADDDPPIAEHRIFAPASDDTAKGEHVYYVASCSNCGHSNFFHRSQVEACLAANPAPVRETEGG
jgi:predicted nucleic-acid-binding Zn-ribbon protein